jgi:uncharacterized UPF0146 family protein
VGLVVEAGLAFFTQTIEERGDPIQPVVIADELGKPGVEEVEDDVIRDEVSIYVGEGR